MGKSKRGAGKSTPMDQQAARRMQAAADKNPASKTAQSGAGRRAQSAADRASASRDAKKR
ncbi:hypothetical protein GCM10010411_76990 [Actinomadura fulvescens]|uniref:Uncharacterized protein n=1 Tax=Actinomadura fulvescens TaxID=46160 RepID=A0ABN3QJN3_9ACTN